MPQFQFGENLIPQLAWLAIFFSILYFGIVRLTLPKLGRTITARETQVSGDLAAAESAKLAADASAEQHKAAIDAAHASGRTTILDAQTKSAAALAKHMAKTQAELQAKQTEADAALSDRRTAALSEIDDAARDIAADIVQRLTGKRPAAGALTKAAKAATGSNMAHVGAPTLPHETTATTEAHGGAEHHEATLLGLGAEGWVYVGLTIFLLLAIFVAKAPKKITTALDERIAETKRTLDEAKALRAEAEALLADAKAKAAASAGDAAAIVSHAEAEAKHLLDDAKAKAKDLTARRQKMAEDKIGAAERAAVDEVRARAASLAASLATEVLRQSHDAKADAALVDAAINDLQKA